ncbi:hypothetical protein [Candidatus Poriferisodalis sp.]|uniref:hypothetical protein n=1 Tax=Candidatus Poriferisodalis sp. TaxID=3101277 RepID=UPI003B01305C
MFVWEVDYRELGRVADAHSRQIVLLRAATRRAVENAAVGILKEAGETAPYNGRRRVKRSGYVEHAKPPGPIESVIGFKHWLAGPLHSRLRSPSGHPIRRSRPNVGARFLTGPFLRTVDRLPQLIRDEVTKLPGWR